MRHGLAWLCVVGGLVGVGAIQGRAPAPVTAGPVLDKATASEVRKLQENRREILRTALKAREKLYQAARVELSGVVETAKRLLTVELDLAATGAERIAAHEKHLEKMEALIEIAKAKVLTGRGTYPDVLDAQDAYVEARIGLLKAGGKLKKAEK
jgi:hypothetical protein